MRVIWAGDIAGCIGCSRVLEDIRDIEIATWAIYGRSVVIKEALHGVLDLPVRWNDAETCKLIDLWLGDLTLNLVNNAIDVPVMKQQHLYKLHPLAHEHEVREQIVNDFYSIQSFYREVAAESQLVIVTEG